MKLSVVSFNTLGATLVPWTFKKTFNLRQRFLKIAYEIEKSSADIVALQEVYTYLHLRFLRRFMSTTYPYCVYKKSIFGPSGGLIVFSKLPLDAPVFRGFKKKGSYLHPTIIGKIARMGVLICKVTDKPFYILNVHLTPNLRMNWNLSNKYVRCLAEQLSELVSIIDGLNKNGFEVILVGDFNTAKESTLYKQFVTSAKVHDLFGHINTPTVHADMIKKGHKAVRIDYIFTKLFKHSAKASKIDHLFTKKALFRNGKHDFLSDHIGLFAKMHFKKKQ